MITAISIELVGRPTPQQKEHAKNFGLSILNNPKNYSLIIHGKEFNPTITLITKEK